MAIGKRIKGFRAKKGLKVRELSEMIGISQGTLSDIENEKTKPSADTLSLIIRHTDINPGWLLTGHGSFTKEPGAANYQGKPVSKSGPVLKSDDETAHSAPNLSGGAYRGEGVSAPDGHCGDAFARIPVYTLAGAGVPKDLSEYEPIDSITLPGDFSGPGIVTVKVRGQSMEPTVWDGAIIGVNTTVLNIVSGDIYAFWLPYEGAVIKRVFVGYEKLILRSDNPNFPPIELPRNELEAGGEMYRLLGRADWIVQRRKK